MRHKGVMGHRDQLRVYLVNVSEVKQKQKKTPLVLLVLRTPGGCDVQSTG
jgi:hypothetical protein